MKEYFVWAPDWDETSDDAKSYFASNMQQAAEDFVGDALLLDGDEVTVRVNEVGSKDEFDVTVVVELAPSYWADPPVKVTP